MSEARIMTEKVSEYYSSEEAFMANLKKHDHQVGVARFNSWARSIAEGRAQLIDFSQRHVREYLRIGLKEIETLRQENARLRNTARG